MGTHGEIGSCIAPGVSKNLGGVEDPRVIWGVVGT